MNYVSIIFAVCALAACKGGGDGAGASSSKVAPAAGSDAGSREAIDAGAGSATGAATAGAASSREYRAALRKGRELARHHEWPGAIAAFEQAEQLAPGDARAISELGWAAFRAGDLDRAEQASQAAAAIDGASVRVKAASLYNLGRVKEARGDKDGAAIAFRASLALRRSRAVRRHLRALERGRPSARPDRPPHEPDRRDRDDDDDDDTASADGPFAAIGDYCDAEAARDDGSAVVCLATSGLAAGADHMETPPPPVRELKVAGMRGELDDVTCLLAFRTTDGWYVWNGVPCETTTAAGTDWAASLGFESPAPGKIVARFAIGIASRGDDARTRHACQEVAVACAIDRAHPACTPPIPIAWASACPDAPSSAAPTIHWDQLATWSVDGDVLVVRPPAHARAAPDGLTDLSAARVPIR